jgi:hypothetical protein
MNITSSRAAVNITSTGTNALDLSTPTDQLSFQVTGSFTNGTGAAQANQQWSDQRTIVTGADDDLDLAGSLVDAFGVTITFTRIKTLIIRNLSATAILSVGGGSAAVTSLFVGAGDALVIPANGYVALGTTSGDGYAVTATTADILRISHSGNVSASANYQIIIIGTV